MAEKITEEFIINDLKMPTKIYIGDSEHIDSGSNEGVFSRNFKCKSKWVGQALLKKVEINSNDNTSSADYLTIIYAPNDKLLNAYKNKSIFDYQKFTNIEVLTYSKNCSIGLNDYSIDTTIDNPGLFADVLEIFNKTNKLEGLIINAYLGNNKFNSLKTQIKNLL